MVSPVREKRAWPSRDRDADGESVAAFEAAVAVVKETVVRSGEVLVSAREDLSDHQRWLKAQSEAVQTDRERHARWVERQRERHEALERREAKRAARTARRQAAFQAVKSGALAAIDSARGAMWSAVGRVVAGLNHLDMLAWSGLLWIWGQFTRLFGSAAAGLLSGLGAATRTLRNAAFAMARSASSAALSARRAIGSGLRIAGAKLDALAPRFTDVVRTGFGGIAARVQHAGGRLAAKTGTLTHAAAARLAPAASGAAARVHALTPALWERLEPVSSAARGHAEAGLARFRGLFAGASMEAGLARFLGFFAGARVPLARAKNALFLPQRMGVELSQMLIIGGAVLLVCGALMLGGGLVLRAGTLSPSPVAETPSEEPIAWLFDHTTLPIDERAIFVYETTADGLRIKGFSVGGVNMSDAPISDLGAVIKPDLHGEELKLDLIVDGAGAPETAPIETPVSNTTESLPADTPQAPASEPPAAETAEAASELLPEPAPPPIVAPDAEFRLVFVFPAPEAPQDVLKASGGLLLTVRYELAGKKRSFIQYLPPSLLEEQLSELQAAASKGS